MLLLQGPIESDYSLAIVNRYLAYALLDIGEDIRLHQRDNTTDYAPSDNFLKAHPRLAPLFVHTPLPVDVHSRYIYPPHTDSMTGELNVMHCYGWEESIFPGKYVRDINGGIHLITVMSEYVRRVLKHSGITVPVIVVGLGADHILAEEPQKIPLAGEAFDFVHVSSCFPRKAPEVLVEAFCREFDRGEHVRLIVKTFPNPHNHIEEILQRARQQYPRHAPIEVWQQPFRPGQMRFLYEHAGSLVAPSRGEGFGLPVAEAMLLGCPVIATAHGGHADLCTPGSFWPVEFRLEPAKTHLTEQQSYWAEPSVDSLRMQMRAVFESTEEERGERSARAKAHISEHFTWRQVAKRHQDACTQVLNSKHQRNALGGDHALHIGFISSWNTRCGIAEYTRYLASNLTGSHRLSIFADIAGTTVRPDDSNVVRCWQQTLDDEASMPGVKTLIQRLKTANLDLVSLQYNFGFFPPQAFQLLMDELKSAGIAVFVTMHSTQHANLKQMATAMQKADLCIVHRQSDLQTLMEAGIDKTVIQRQGILIPAVDRTKERNPAAATDSFVLASFGFFLPAKGIDRLLQAFELASRVNPRLRLKLLNALYPVPESTAYATACLDFIKQKGLSGRIQIWTEFLPEEDILAELTDSDLIVLPYTHTRESSSAAIRLPLASLTPVLCSDLSIFDEFSDVVHRYPASDVIALAHKILQLAEDRNELGKFRSMQHEYVESLSWRKVAGSFMEWVDAHITAAKAEQSVTATHASGSYRTEAGISR